MKRKEFLLFTLPSGVVMVSLMLVPLLMLLWFSFNNVSAGAKSNFIGLDNYAQEIMKPRFWSAVGWTLIYTVITVVLELTLGFIVAYALDRVKWGRAIFISLILLPFIITPVVGTLLLRLMFKDPGGFYGWFLGWLSGAVSMDLRVDWFASQAASTALLLLYKVWQATPFVILVFYAGLTSMNREPEESALIDGANWWQRILYVTLPAMRSLILFVSMVAVMDNYREFDSVRVMTEGGNGTESIMFYNYVVSFGESALGRGSAVSVLTIIGIALLLAPFLYGTYKEQLEKR